MKSIPRLILLIFLASIVHAAPGSLSVPPVPKPTAPILIDEYGEISLEAEKRRLEIAAKQIKDYQSQFDSATVPIMFFGEKCSALKRANRAKAYLAKTEGIESKRIFTLYGGGGKDLRIVVYLLPAELPENGLKGYKITETDCQEKRRRPKPRSKMS